jgi:hypothetical protein
MRASYFVGAALAGFVAAIPHLVASDSAPAFAEAKSGQFVFRLLPKSAQKEPLVDVTVITEMSQAGREVRSPSAGSPAYYVARTVGYHDAGQGVRGERPVPAGELQERLEKALAAAHYLPAANGQAASLAMIFVWGSSNALDDSASVDGLLDPTNTPDDAHRAMLDRAALVGGDRFAAELGRVLQRDDAQQEANIEGPSPLGAFVGRDYETRRLFELAQTDNFYVVASAYDAAELAKGRKVLLWRTKITTASQGVAMGAALPRLMIAGEPFFGRDMPKAVTMTGHIIPDGTVDVGQVVSVEQRGVPGVLPENQGGVQYHVMPSSGTIISGAGRGP